MDASALIVELLQDLGAFSVLSVLAVLALRSLFTEWLARRIAAGVEEGVQRRLAGFQLELDKELEKYRSTLSTEFEAMRSRLRKEATDYAIWAEHRHEATAKLFADFLEAEVEVTATPRTAHVDADNSTPQELISLAEELNLEPHLIEELTKRVAVGAPIDARREISRFREAWLGSAAVRARNRVDSAYYAAALYLSPLVDQAARSVRDDFHKLMTDRLTDCGHGVGWVEAKSRLRGLLLEFQNRARSDLSTSVPSALTDDGAQGGDDDRSAT